MKWHLEANLCRSCESQRKFGGWTKTLLTINGLIYSAETPIPGAMTIWSTVPSARQIRACDSHDGCPDDNSDPEHTEEGEVCARDFGEIGGQLTDHPLESLCD